MDAFRFINDVIIFHMEHNHTHTLQMFNKLEGLLENNLKSYTKKSLCNILLTGEKPYLPDKFVHNKHIFFTVQTFIFKSKRLTISQRNAHPA